MLFFYIQSIFFKNGLFLNPANLQSQTNLLHIVNNKMIIILFGHLKQDMFNTINYALQMYRHTRWHVII